MKEPATEEGASPRPHIAKRREHGDSIEIPEEIAPPVPAVVKHKIRKQAQVNAVYCAV